MYHEIFMQSCEENLDVINIEKDLNEVNINFSRVEVEQLDKDTMCVLRKARKCAEGSKIGIRKSQ